MLGIRAICNAATFGLYKNVKRYPTGPRHLVKTIRSLYQSVFAVGFLFLLLANTVLSQQSVIHGRVVDVTDGDTLKVLVADQKLLRISLAFCDAPEKKQAFGARAKQAMSDLVCGKDIELRPHAIDRYGIINRSVSLIILCHT
jgi:endonuclease YncB( thermonuclease family)